MATKSGIRGSLGVLAGLLVGVAALPGCIVVDNGPGGGGYVNYAPFIAETYVDCTWDSYYATYVWDFVAYVDDQNGYLDVTDAYVDVIDIVYDPYSVAESWPLAYDVNGQWSQSIYEYNGSGNPSDYSHVLYCEYLWDFEFDFYAYDRDGASDGVTYIPY